MSNKPKNIIKNNNNKNMVFPVIGAIMIGILAGVIFVYILQNDNVEAITSTLDGKYYEVRSNSAPDIKQTAANYLSDISKKGDLLVNYMNIHNIPDQESAKRLKSRWSNCVLRETSSNEKSAAYTVNKGEEMRLCIRNRNGTFEDSNTAFFVIIHEMAHLCSTSWGHNEEFRDYFSQIVSVASSLGLYKPQDFVNNPVTYCGTEINTTPCSNGICNYSGMENL